MNLSPAAMSVLDSLRDPVPARRVMVANARARAGFAACLLGRFERMGPNTWDDYQLRPADGSAIDVWPTVKLQVERDGAVFRMRHRGGVILAEWAPASPADDDRERFVNDYIDAFGAAKGSGAAAFIARTLSG